MGKETPEVTYSQATDPLVGPPAGFLQDPDDQDVWWGEPENGSGYRLQPAWTVGAGYSVELDVPNGLYPDQVKSLLIGLKKVGDLIGVGIINVE